MNRKVLWLTRTILIAIGLGTLGMQILLPIQASIVGETYYEVKDLVLPYSVAAVLAVACIQICLIGVWRIVESVFQSTFYRKSTARWINLLRYFSVAGAVIPGVVTAHLLFFVHIGGPGVVIAFAAAIIGGTASYLLLTIMRRIFLEAKENHDELSRVV